MRRSPSSPGSSGRSGAARVPSLSAQAGGTLPTREITPGLPPLRGVLRPRAVGQKLEPRPRQPRLQLLRVDEREQAPVPLPLPRAQSVAVAEHEPPPLPQDPADVPQGGEEVGAFEVHQDRGAVDVVEAFGGDAGQAGEGVEDVARPREGRPAGLDERPGGVEGGDGEPPAEEGRQVAAAAAADLQGLTPGAEMGEGHLAQDRIVEHGVVVPPARGRSARRPRSSSRPPADHTPRAEGGHGKTPARSGGRGARCRTPPGGAFRGRCGCRRPGPGAPQRRSASAGSRGIP